MVSENDYINTILALHFAGEKLTDDQERCLIDWVCQHKKEYQTLSKTLQCIKSEKTESLDVDSAWKVVHDKLNVMAANEQNVRPTQPKVFSFGRIYQSVAYAACLAVLIGISVFYLTNDKNEPRLYSNTTQQLQTVMLPDSSMVTLYPHASVSYLADTKKHLRKTELDGNAFFRVKPNKQLPFWVSNGKTSIRVVGTAFLVTSRSETETGIFVQEGVVEVSTHKESVVIKADEQAISDGHKLVKTTIEEPELLFDKHYTKKLYKNTLLNQVIRDLEDEFNVEILASDAILANRISTQLKLADVEEILSEISYICNLKYRKISNRQYELYNPF